MRSETIFIDIGSSSVRVQYTGEVGFRELPALAVVDPAKNRLIAWGAEAEELASRLPKGMELRFPFKGGALNRYLLAKHILSSLIATKATFFGAKPRVIVSSYHGASQIERRLLQNIFLEAGAADVQLVPQTFCIALAAGLPLSGSKLVTVSCFGAQRSEIAGYSSGGLMQFQTVSMGYQDLLEVIENHLASKYRIYLPSQELFLLLNDSFGVDQGKVSLRAVSTVSREMTIVELDRVEVYQEVRGVLSRSVALVESYIQALPLSFAADVIERGVVLAGGMAELRGIDSYFAQALKLPTHLLPDPRHSVIAGLVKFAEIVEDAGMYDFSFGWQD